jgi:cytochrome bd-type quinol oxidase subunit 2
MNFLPWLSILMLFVISNFLVSFLVNKELDKSNVSSEKLKNIRLYNNVIQLTSLVFLTIILTSFITRRFGCKQKTSGKHFALLSQIALFIFTLVVMILSILCLVDENFSLLNGTDVKSYLVGQIVICVVLILLGLYQIYSLFSKKSDKEEKIEKRKYDWF